MKNQPMSETYLVGKRRAPAGSDVRVWSPGEDPAPAKKPQWRIKTYYAASMQHAMADARMELGEDAIILSSRPTLPHHRHLGEYEVVFGVGPTPPPAESPAPRTQPTPTPRVVEPPPATIERSWENDVRTDREQSHGSLDVAGMRRQLLQIQELLSQTGIRPRLPRLPQAEEWHSHLISNGLSDDFAIQVINEAADRLKDFSEGQNRVRDALAEALKANFRIDASLGVAGYRSKIVALVGPPGCGKTTTVIKLAIREGMLTQTPTTLVGLDHERISAAQQMESFASILGLSFCSIDTIPSLEQYLDSVGQGELAIIDTNGISASDVDSGKELAEFLHGRKDVDVQLVVPADMRDSDLSRMIDRFAVFGPKKLLFTKIDETESFGALVREASRTGKPLSFLSAGKRIPEDLERATPDGIARLVLHGREWRRMAGALR